MFLRHLQLVFLVFSLISLTANAAEEKPSSNKLRGGGTLKLDSITEQFNRLVEGGEHDKAIAFIKLFAVQKRRNEEERKQLFLLLTQEALDNKHYSEYAEYIETAKQIDKYFGHYLNVINYYHVIDKSSSVESLIWLASNRYEKLNNLNYWFIWQVYRDLEDKDRKLTLLESLYLASYQPLRIPGYTSSLYVELVQLYLERKEVTRAENVINTSTSRFSDNILIWHDKRFEKIWSFHQQKANFSPVKAVTQYIKQIEYTLENTNGLTWEEWIKGKDILVNEYLGIGKTVEAIDTATKALARVPKELREHDSYLWLTQALASAYEQANDWQNAMRTMDNLVQLDIEKNSTVINFIINYSILLLNAGLSNEALAVADDVLTTYQKYVNDHGEYFAMAVKVCALVELRKNGEAKKVFSLMNQSVEKNYVAVNQAAFCLGDYASLARIALLRFDEPEQRQDVLASFSDYSVKGLSTKQKVYYRAYRKLLEREDIRKAINRHGRVKSWPLPARYWFEFF